MSEDATGKRRAFRELLRKPGLTMMPGGFSPIYARTAELAGFECFFVAGSQMSAFLLGVPDTGVIGLRDVADHARHVASRSSIPVLLDADTGFGNAVNVHFTVQELVRSGVAGLSLEDQEAPKKSGTSAGRKCIPVEEAVGKIRAAVAARDALDPEFVICARCDAIGAQGETFDDALARCVAYARDGGADLVWLNSAQSLEQIATAVREVPAPLLMIWGGKPPGPSFEELEATGLRIALYPTLAASAGLQAAWRVLNDFRTRGVAALADWRADVASSPYGAIDLSVLTRSGDVKDLERRFLSEDAQRDYATTFGHGTHLGFGDPPKG
ncbi:MAG: isocitrate lyase/PEP mutase family protein [Hyphomicrobiales bacterium]|nr:isocitrate lyase/PEP mutase family protein [Hyphomicrobiales bacterium]